MKGLMILANGFEDVEAIATIDVLKRAHVNLTLANLHSKNEVTTSANNRLVVETNLKEIKSYGKTKEKQVALMDYGFKHNIVNTLLKLGVGVTVYPASTPAEKIIESKPDGIILSNGPGDPTKCEVQIKNVKKQQKKHFAVML